MDSEDIAAEIHSGNIRKLARAITYVENDYTRGKEILDRIPYHNISTQVIGVTGPPGSGKSTLVNELIGIFRSQGLKVAVLALDPTSPYSGGAILGDRVRMLQYSSDNNVYIRSMASRGRLGGLSHATFDTVMLLHHAQFDKIIIETVGAGQSEVDIVRNSDTTIVLTVPGLGDDIQVIKAGIMEIADIFVVNKSDMSGSDGLATQIRNMIDLVPTKTEWDPPIVKTSATNKDGIQDLIEEIEKHWQYLQENDRLDKLRMKQLKFNLIQKINSHVTSKLLDEHQSEVQELVKAVYKNNLSIIQAFHDLVSHLS